MGSAQRDNGTVAGQGSQRLEALLERGEQTGCIELSEVNELVDALDLSEAQVNSLLDRIDAAGRQARGRLRA